MVYRYTDKELEQLIETIVILADTREQKNTHVLKWFDEFKHKSGKIGISYRKKKLDSGDYSFFLPANPDMGILKDVYFNNLFVVEKKKDLDELSGNFTAYRDRFRNEFSRSKAKELYLLVEGGSISHIHKHRYMSAMSPKSYKNSLYSFEIEYGIHTHFVTPDCTADTIWNLIRIFFIHYMTDETR